MRRAIRRIRVWFDRWAWGWTRRRMEAVRKYKFKPAMKDGKTPVPVMITVEVNFRLY